LGTIPHLQCSVHGIILYHKHHCQSCQCRSLVECPALYRLDHEVPVRPTAGRHQRLVIEGGAGLGAALAQTRIKPQPELTLARANCQAIRVASGKVRVVSRPVVDLEPRRGLEQEGLAGAVEVLREHEGRGHEGAEHVVVRVLDADKRRAVGRSAAVSVEAGEAEAMRGCGEDQPPVSADQTSRKPLR